MTHAEGEFDRISAVTPVGAGRFSVEVPDGWQQGRGAFGGLVLALLTRAAEAVVADAGRPLRALSGEIVGPVQPGPAAIAVEVLRAGTGVTAVAARLEQDGAVQAHAVVACGKARATYAAAPGLPAPSPPPWRSIEPAPVGPPLAPVFTQHLEFRVTGPLPFSGARAAGDERAEGWVRLRRPGEARDAALAVALIDSFWPALLASAPAPRPVATLTFGFQLVTPLAGLDPDAPLFYRARMLAGGDGYGSEMRELWSEDGRLVALNQQTIVVMR